MLLPEMGLWKFKRFSQSAVCLTQQLSLAILLMSSQSRAEDATNALSEFRLADGTTVPIEKWTTSYETLEYQPPLSTPKARETVRFDQALTDVKDTERLFPEAKITGEYTLADGTQVHFPDKSDE